MTSETPLSILLAGDYPADPTLGSAKVFYKLREEFQTLGHRCDIVFTDEIAGPRARQIRQLVSPWTARAAIARRVRSARYDVLDVASAEGLWLGLSKRAGALRRTAYICRSNGLEQLNYRRMLDDHTAGLTRKPWSRRLWYPLSRLSQVAAAARTADRLLLLNENDRRYAAAHRWLPEDRIDVVAHGVSQRFLADAPAADARRGEGLLFCGSWDHAKGVAYLVEAMTRLDAAGTPLPLTVLGPGLPAAQVRDQFPAAVRDRVRIIARVPEDEVIAMYRAHDLLVWPSTYEGFGLVVIEAMSQGLPVVATPAGCVPSVLRHGVNGIVVAPRDGAAMADAVGALMADPARRRALGVAARATVAGMTWRATAERTIEIYRQALHAA